MLISKDSENSKSFSNGYGELIIQTHFFIVDELHTVVITGARNWAKVLILVVSAHSEDQEAVYYDPDVVKSSDDRHE